eukprot:scaffold72_cov274-Chaetoceros_neogracile.AAC.15
MEVACSWSGVAARCAIQHSCLTQFCQLRQMLVRQVLGSLSAARKDVRCALLKQMSKSCSSLIKDTLLLASSIRMIRK